MNIKDLEFVGEALSSFQNHQAQGIDLSKLVNTSQSESETKHAIAQAVLAQLVEALGLQDVNAKIIQDLLKQISSPPTPIREESTKNEETLLTEEKLTSPDQIESLLQSSQSAIQEIKHGATSTLEREAVRKELLSTVLDPIIKEIAATIDELSKAITSEGHAKVPDLQSTPLKVSEPLQELQKIIEFIRNSNGPKSEEIKEFISEHLMTIQADGIKADPSILSGDSNNVLQPLINTLQSVERRLAQSTTPEEIAIRTFAKELREALTSNEQNFDSKAFIKKILSEALTTINERWSNDSIPLPEKASRELLKIKSQLQVILANPELELDKSTSLTSIHNTNKLQSNINEIKESFIKFQGALPATLKSILQEPMNKFNDSLESLMKQIAVESTPKELFSNVTKLLEFVQNIELLTNKAADSISSGLPKELSILRNSISSTLEQIEKTSTQTSENFNLIQATKNLTLSLDGAISQLRVLDENSPTLQNLRDIQRLLLDKNLSKDQFKTILKEISTELETITSSALSDLSTEKVENSAQHEKQLNTKNKDALLKQLTPFNSSKPIPDLINTQSIKSEMSALRNLDQMIQGQDLINKLNPLMDALGEPTFILFPTLLQGLLTKTEVSFFKATDDVDNERSKRKAGRGGSNFSCALITLDLPSMGKVGVHLAHRTDEILVSLTLESETLKEFLEPKLSRLSLILQGAGFKTPDISIKVGAPLSIVPQWVETTGRPRPIVA